VQVFTVTKKLSVSLFFSLRPLRQQTSEITAETEKTMYFHGCRQKPNKSCGSFATQIKDLIAVGGEKSSTDEQAKKGPVDITAEIKTKNKCQSHSLRTTVNSHHQPLSYFLRNLFDNNNDDCHRHSDQPGTCAKSYTASWKPPAH
jgi:hypothetical protein